jgi:hypothetical protein
MKVIESLHLKPRMGAFRMRSFPAVLSQLLVVILAASGQPGRAEEKEFLFQKIEFKGGKWVGVGNGPFSDAYTNGVAPDDADFSGARLDATMFEERQFGSIGAAKGGQFKNMTKKKVRDLHFTILKKGDKFKNTSKDGDDFDVSFDTDADGNSTMTLTAKEGKELNPNEVLWMKIPEGDQPGGNRKPIYKGKLTDDPPPKPRTKEEKPPKAEDNGGGGGGGQKSKISYDFGSNSVSFQMMPIEVVQYADGTIVVSNNLVEPILGCAVSIGPLQVLGPSPDVPGATILSDSGLTLQQGTNVLFGAALVDVLLVPDSSQSGFDSVLQGTLAWEQAVGGSGSRYLYEHFYFFEEACFFFRSSLLTATGGLLQNGQSDGAGYLTAVSGGDIPPSPSRLENPGTMFNGFGFQLTGESNRTYLVQDSVDLVNWVPFQPVQSMGSPIPVFDPTFLNFSQHFYRAAQVSGGLDGNTWVISVFAGNGGTVAPSGNVLTSTGSSLLLMASPLTNYLVHAWFVDGFLAQTGGTTFNLMNIGGDHDVQATFKVQQQLPSE